MSWHRHRWVDSDEADPRLPCAWYQRCRICGVMQEDGHGRYVGDHGHGPDAAPPVEKSPLHTEVQMTLQERFAALDDSDEYLKFDRVVNKFSKRRDMHAFMLLDIIVPPTDETMVAACHKEEMWLSTDMEALEAVITDAQILELTRCGVRYDEEFDCLGMFV